ncbi:MAG: peptidoglycan-binding protein [Eubacteriales bacterium]|nr:peptidoglycan-binding protein [Eubacteriales bacterium]
MNRKRISGILAAVLAALLLIPLIISCLSGMAYAAPRTLQKGSRGDDVTALQKQLNTLKYLSVAPTGVFGTATRTAVINFQKDNKLAADGIVGTKTYAALEAAVNAAGGAAPTTTPAPAATTPPAGSAPASLTYSRLLRRGTSGTDVKNLQLALNALGHPVGNADGVFGTKTTNAVKAFQAAKSLKADGLVGAATVKALNEALAALTPATPTPTPEATATPAATTEPTPTPQTTPVPAVVKRSELVGADGYKYYAQQITTTLKRGSSGYHVKDLQAALKALGYYSSTVDGKFGTGTYNAVRTFQSRMGLDCDGLAGNYTLAVLYTMIHSTEYSSIVAVNYPVDLNLPLVKPLWADNAKLFPKQSTATIVDVRTGKTFLIKRTGGTNHADCEPVSFNDTKTLYECYGNKWNWARRPIWVIVNGQRLAASMNGMPHGYNSLSDNGMRGQICIHFVNSRTHGSNKVDAEHQACINEAYAVTTIPGIMP